MFIIFPHMQNFPIINMTHQSGKFSIINKPTQTYHYHPRSQQFYVRVHCQCCTFCELGKKIMMCIHCLSIIQNFLTFLKSCVWLILICPLQPWQLLIFLLSSSLLPFSECHMCCASSLSCVRLFVTPWSVHGDSPGKNTEVGCHSLLQGIFPTQGSNPGLLHCRKILYHLSHQGSPQLYVFKVSSSFDDL